MLKNDMKLDKTDEAHTKIGQKLSKLQFYL